MQTPPRFFSPKHPFDRSPVAPPTETTEKPSTAVVLLPKTALSTQRGGVQRPQRKKKKKKREHAIVAHVGGYTSLLCTTTVPQKFVFWFFCFEQANKPCTHNFPAGEINRSRREKGLVLEVEEREGGRACVHAPMVEKHARGLTTEVSVPFFVFWSPFLGRCSAAIVLAALWAPRSVPIGWH